MTGSPTSRRFFSLKWRAFLFTSLVLLGVEGLFAAYSYYELRQQFEDRRAAAHAWYVRQVQGVVDQSAKRLRQWSTAVASLPEVQAALEHGANGGVVQLNRLIAGLGLDLGVEAAAVFAADGSRLVAHGLVLDEKRAKQMAEAVERAMTREIPVIFHQCGDTCVQYAAAPVLGVQRSAGAVLLGISLADAVVDFQRISGTDIGLLVLSDGDDRGSGLQRRLTPWNADVVALSNAVQNLTLLSRFAEVHPDFQSQGVAETLRFNERDFEIRLARLNQMAPDSQAYLVLIEDIGGELRGIESTARRGIAIGVGGWLGAEILLLAVLWTPLSRLRRAADYLPRLAESAYGEVRAIIAAGRGFSWTRDEVDILDDTATALADRLEAMGSQLRVSNGALAERMVELEQEKEFVTQLIDSSPAIILTLDGDCRIVQINRQGERLTGHGTAELQSEPFSTLMSPEALDADLAGQLGEWLEDGQGALEQEWDLRRKDGTMMSVMWHHSRLAARVNNPAVLLSVGVDITARKRAELRLAWLADHDPLTRLFNRRRFQEELRETIALAQRYQHGGALLFVDLDHFKDINDTAGHRAGDFLLERVGEELYRILREGDVIGRVGGDEFAVILPRATPEEAETVAQKILSHLGAREFGANGRSYQVSASVGVALFPRDGDTVEELLAHADIAMYQVKETGRGGWNHYSATDQSHRLIQDRLFWKQELERAVLDKRFLLYVQPIVDLAQSHASHYEVLLRMVNDAGEIILPAQFIQVAEHTGMIRTIDRVVLGESVRCLATLARRGIAVAFSINLSAHAFSDPSLPAYLRSLLEETGVDPSKVVLELTETAAVADLDAAKRLAEAIRTLGCRLALDDFGTGYSSFFYLKELPMDFIKIDGSFIRNLAERPDDQAMVRAMSQIVQAFGKKTIAEQVETEETLHLLEQFQIDFVQGHLTGRPAPVADVFGA